MMSKVHYWIVCDAVEFIKKFGDDEQKRALQTFQIGYGEKEPIETIPRSESAMEYLVGFEAWQTDKYRDLALSLQALPRGGKHFVTGLGWHHFTAFNHFINPYPEVGSAWPRVCGYSYATSSMAGFDSVVVQGISRCLHGLVDADHSLVLDRIKPFWKEGEQEWKDNFERTLSNTRFAPWSVLAQVYYSHFILNHYEPLEVRGANEHIAGLQLLGPVVHAIADACSPQHVRSVLGFGHAIWENYVKSRAYDGRITVDSTLIRQFLHEDPFRLALTVEDGPMSGKMDVESLMCRLSLKTADRLMQSMAMGWKDLWQAEGEFWRRYLTGKRMREDALFFYNMAVAGTVYAIVRSCADLINQGVLSADRGLLNPEKMPDLPLAQSELPEFPLRRTGPDSMPPEEVMPVPFSHAGDILGFDPIGETDLPLMLNQARIAFGSGPSARSDEQKRTALLKNIERAVIEQYVKMAGKVGEGFCPLRAVDSIPVESDLSAHFGSATFRMPSAEECDDPGLLSRYIELSDAHAYTAYKLQLTHAVAALRFRRAQFAQHEATASRLEYIASEVEKFRDVELNEAAHAFTVASLGLSSVAEVESERSESTSSARTFLAAAQEKISGFFTVVPKMALATVAAAALLLIIIIPRGGVPEPPVLGLSAEQWKPAKIRLMGPGRRVPKSVFQKEVPVPAKPKLAVLIYFRDFDGPVDQAVIDSAYKAIRPTYAMAKRYDMIAPHTVKTAVEKGEINTKSTEQTLADLRTKLNVKTALVVTITARAELFEIESSLKDLDNDRLIRTEKAKGVTKGELDSAVRKSMIEMLAPRR